MKRKVPVPIKTSLPESDFMGNIREVLYYK
jgi:hypothetical protein